MEVLLKYEGSCREILIPVESVDSTLVESVREISGKEISICIGPERLGSGEPHLLQRWSKKWDKFVDVISQSELSSGDRLRVILKPGSSSKESVSTTGLCVEYM